MFDDGITAIGKPNFNLRRNLKERFIGEPAVDDGGLKKGIFCLFHNALAEMPSVFWVLPNNCGISLSHNVQGLFAMRFEICGKVITLGLIHGCEAPMCFSQEICDFLVFGKEKDPDYEYMLRSPPDCDIQKN